jgi:hypothetical protein
MKTFSKQTNSKVETRRETVEDLLLVQITEVVVPVALLALKSPRLCTPPCFVQRVPMGGGRWHTTVENGSAALSSGVAVGVRVIKRRFRSKRAQRYIRLQLSPSKFS